MTGSIRNSVRTWLKWMRSPSTRWAAMNSIASSSTARMKIERDWPSICRSTSKRSMTSVNDSIQRILLSFRFPWPPLTTSPPKRIILLKSPPPSMTSARRYHSWTYCLTSSQKWRTSIWRRRLRRPLPFQLKATDSSHRLKTFAHPALINSKRSTKIWRRR